MAEVSFTVARARRPVTIVGHAPTHAYAEFRRIWSWDTSVYFRQFLAANLLGRVDQHLKSAIQTHEAKDCIASASSGYLKER